MDADYARNRDSEGGPFVTYERVSDKHGGLAVAAATNRLGLGDKIRLIPGHCDPAVDLRDWYAFFGGNLHRLGQADHRPARCVDGGGHPLTASGVRQRSGGRLIAVPFRESHSH